MSKGAQAASGVTTYRVLRQLGQRAFHTFAAIRAPHELVVLQRFVKAGVVEESGARESIDNGATALSPEAMALMLRDARCLAKHWHPNIARVRHVDLIDGELFLASDLVDGTTLDDLFRAAKETNAGASGPTLALPILVRVLVDVLTGLSALHGLRDGMNAPLGTMHGALCPANVVVGRDGVGRLLNPMRARPVRVEVGSEALGHAAPEALDGDGTSDQRADVYSVGVMLWEALTGHRLYDETDPVRVLQRQRGDDLAEPDLAKAPEFAGLSKVAMRALSFDPALRYKNAAEMASDLRRVAGARIASGSAVALAVVELTGERLRARRADLDPAVSGTRRKASERAIEAVRTNKGPEIASAIITAVPHLDDVERAPATAREPQDVRPSLTGDRPTVAMPEPSAAMLAKAVTTPAAGYTTDPTPTDPSELAPEHLAQAPAAVVAPAPQVPQVIAKPAGRPPVPKPIAKPPVKPAARPAKPVVRPARDAILPGPAATEDDDEFEVEELPGPRGSSPVLVVDPAPLPARSVRPHTTAIVSPLTPHIPAPPQAPGPDFVAMPVRLGTPSELSVPVGRDTSAPTSTPAGAVGFERATAITGVNTPSRRVFRIAIAIAAIAVALAAAAFFMTKTKSQDSVDSSSHPASGQPVGQPTSGQPTSREPGASETTGTPIATATMATEPAPVAKLPPVNDAAGATGATGASNTTNKVPAGPVIAPASPAAPVPTTQPARTPSKPKKSVYDPLGI